TEGRGGVSHGRRGCGQARSSVLATASLDSRAACASAASASGYSCPMTGLSLPAAASASAAAARCRNTAGTYSPIPFTVTPQQRGGPGQAEPVRHRDKLLRGHGHLLGISAGPAAPPGVRDDRPAGPAGVHAVTERDHLPGDPVARDVRRPDREEVHGPAGPDE